MPAERIFHSTDGVEVPLICDPRCKFCSKPVPDEYAHWARCPDCTARLRGKHPENSRLHPYSFLRAFSISMYIPDSTTKGFLGNLILDLKNGGKFPGFLMEIVEAFYNSEFEKEDIDVLVPVPSINSTGRINEKIVYSLRELTGILCEEVLYFMKDAISSKSLGGPEKFNNLRGKIGVINKGVIRNSTILLVDDIMTTLVFQKAS